ncbi:TPA: hypothetical protein RQ837_006603 [Pseudomonas aeruginosa]|uniref:Uncharacterized protein n=3 Tax=Gammaproteobacteria TaxID=1236 RepID=A0AAQ3R4Q4_PSEAI|nr:hypothetical protein [Pseudomonas aeruginosa]EIU4790664.1 hypothetical protein [Pseudomonas aeruginosa]EKM6410523.1 hypothetical protein [Pseudomonas aeruginosa]EKT8215946.1 hypothetical protein [Pseudomonas aeruginosa]EKV5209620.1 hypothetical protein [Pseudomonas aeruginosa]ELB6590297.1 hypothetical protein [Pseudomonas aeruginosa]
MTWFVVSIASTIELLAPPQEEYPIYEDFYLFEAHSEVELQKKIKSTMQIIDSAGDCTYQGSPAKQKCLGTRKVRSIYNPPPSDLDSSPPSDGTELSHSFFIASSLKDAEDFAQGKSVLLKCVDDSEE